MAELNDLKVVGNLEVTGEITSQNTIATSLDGLTATVTELNYMDGVTSNVQTQLNSKAASSHTHSNYATSDHTHSEYASSSHSHSNYAASSHGNHVPTTQTASNKVFLRNDNTWATVTPANIGAAASSHGNHVPATQTASNKVFLRNDNTWQTITPANIGAAASSHTHSYAASSHSHSLSSLGAKYTCILSNGSSASSISWTSGAYDFIVGISKPNASNTPCQFAIPVGFTGDFQIADDATYSIFTVSATSMSYKSGNNAKIICAWGVNVV